MFKRLQINLTLLCATITSIILIIISTINLIFYKNNLYETEYNIFLNNANSIYYYFQSQNNISLQWVIQYEENDNIYLYAEDNGQPLTLNKFNSSSNYSELIEKIKVKALSKYSFNLDGHNTISSMFTFIDFTITHDKTEYFVSVGSIPKNNGYISAIIFYPLDSYYTQLYKQVIFYVATDIIAIILLTIFSYLFSKKAIKPVIESKEKQNKFIAAASHELRTPLSVIISSTSALEKASVKEEKEKFINIINSEGNRMSKLINDMLILASANNKSWSVNFNLEEIDTILLDTYENYELIAKEKNINFFIELPEEEIPKYKCDKDRLIQVLFILINNAFSYSKENGTVKLKLLYKNNIIKILVIDNGVGISEKDKLHIFEPFYRSDKSHNSKDHFGLGLSVAKEIISLHKGTLTVDDTEGGGSTFIIKLYY